MIPTVVFLLSLPVLVLIFVSVNRTTTKKKHETLLICDVRAKSELEIEIARIDDKINTKLKKLKLNYNARLLQFRADEEKTRTYPFQQLNAALKLAFLENLEEERIVFFKLKSIYNCLKLAKEDIDRLCFEYQIILSMTRSMTSRAYPQWDKSSIALSRMDEQNLLEKLQKIESVVENQLIDSPANTSLLIEEDFVQ